MRVLGADRSLAPACDLERRRPSEERRGETMTMRSILARLVIPASAVALGLLVPDTGVSAQKEEKFTERFTGFAINMNSGPKTATVDFTITRWSTDAEREKLLAILKENKNPTDPLLRALQKMPKVGYIRTPERLAWDLRYARQTPLDEGGRQIVLATDRPIGFAEARNQPRSIDYPFTVLEIHLDKTDRGEGKILVGTKIYIDKKNNLVLENYAQQPVRFNEIHPLK
jgi:hypothetical protein